MAGLYLHIPFCEHKCIYCDFYSIAPQDASRSADELIGRFLTSLKTEIALRAQEERFQVSYETIFFGGGTPSLLSPSSIEQVLSLLAGSFAIERGAEITLETNPGTVDLAKLRAFRSAGVNRLSVGVQSFHDDELRFLSRIHTSGEAKECLRDASRAGFHNVSLDLVFALPSQTKERWDSSLRQAVELEPKHLSCYSLIVEPNTPLSRMVESRQVSLVDVEEDATLYEQTMEYLGALGYEQYEVSNFAKPGYESRHNSNYWNHTNYLGFGPSAHSFWSAASLVTDARRWWNIASVVGYSERLECGSMPVTGEEKLTIEQLVREEILLGLRSGGIDVAGFRRRYNSDLLTERGSEIEGLISDEMATLEGGRLRLTAKGYLVCDEICAALSD
jgi:oxygen-independent coproporphyrinogen-3 oxidase